MLDEVKQIYKQTADSLPIDWVKEDKNNLINLACEYRGTPLEDAYVAAVMLRYWSKISKYYSRCKLVATPEDIHEWLTIAVLYTLDKQPWKNPKLDIYNDVNGPDKVLNRAMESKRLTFYQQLNRYNRKINSDTLSLSALTTDYKDVFTPTYHDIYAVEVNDVVLKFFNKKEYMTAFILDTIFHEKIIIEENNIKKLCNHLRHIDTVSCKIFSHRYNIPLEIVENAASYILNLSPIKLKKRVEYSLIRLKNMLKESDYRTC